MGAENHMLANANRLIDRYYPPPRVDPLDAVFSEHAAAGMTVLDAGCGGSRGCAPVAERGDIYIIGVDVVPEVASNPFCDDVLLADLSRLPFRDESFDIIHCRWVLEHVADPAATLREVARLLKPGGRFLAVTPNLYHYTTLGARVTPMAFHRWWHRDQYDPFPTHYRANTSRALRKLASAAGLRVAQLRLIEGPPHYLTRYPLLFRCGVAWERLLNAVPFLAPLRQRIVMEFVRPR